MPPVDPYQILQVSPSAEQEVLRAAYRALAMKYHPDRDASARASRRMIELNQAYEMVREPELRAQVDKARRRSPFEGASITPMNGQVKPPQQRGNDTGTRLDTGRYSGWSLKDLASHDPDYLRWLLRHSSGVRYRREISLILGAKGAATG